MIWRTMTGWQYWIWVMTFLCISDILLQNSKHLYSKQNNIVLELEYKEKPLFTIFALKSSVFLFNWDLDRHGGEKEVILGGQLPTYVLTILGIWLWKVSRSSEDVRILFKFSLNFGDLWWSPVRYQIYQSNLKQTEEIFKVFRFTEYFCSFHWKKVSCLDVLFSIRQPVFVVSNLILYFSGVSVSKKCRDVKDTAIL